MAGVLAAHMKDARFIVNCCNAYNHFIRPDAANASAASELGNRVAELAVCDHVVRPDE